MALNSFSRDNDPIEFDKVMTDLSNLLTKNVNDYDETDKNKIQTSKEKLYNDFSLSSVIDICYQYHVLDKQTNPMKTYQYQYLDLNIKMIF